MTTTVNARKAGQGQSLPLGSVLMELRGFQRIEAVEGKDTPLARATVVFTTGAAVRRYDWLRGRYYDEVLEVSEEAVNLERLERGAPVLDSHSAWSLSSQFGRTENPNIKGGRGTVDVVFSRRPDAAGKVQDVQDGITRNVSVGYTRDKVEMVPPKDTTDPNAPWTYRVKRWTPHEVSFVPINADMDAQLRGTEGNGRSLEVREFPAEIIEVLTTPTAAAAGLSTEEVRQMEDEKKPAAPVAPDHKALADARAAGVQDEQKRQADIRSRVKLAKLPEEFARKLIDESVAGEAITSRIFEQLAADEARTSSRSATDATIVRDEVDTRRANMQEALIARAEPSYKAKDGAREYRGMSLIDMARECLHVAGASTRGLSRREVAVAALNLDKRTGQHSTSDFPEILASTVNRSLRAAYDLAPRTFTAWARQSTAPDFRQVARTQMSEISAFQKVNEGGEYKYLSFGDSAEKYSLAKYGGIVAITWETLINDDLDGLSRLPRMIGDEAAGTESDIVYGILSTNAALADGVALFHATHGNLPTAAAIAVASLGIMRAAIRKQTGPKGRALNLAPEILLCGPDKESEALQYTSANFVAAKSLDVNPQFNTSLEVVVEQRITGNKWYGLCKPNRVDTVEYAGLEGEQGVYTEQRTGFEVDGLQIKARHVFAAKAIDFRGMVYNSGA